VPSIGLSPTAVEAFRRRVWEQYQEHGRHDLPWRQTRDPYAVLVSEVMLQQTQVSRVLAKYGDWLTAFPSVDALGAAPLEAVLRAWQGLGYNRRAVNLKRTAEVISDKHAGRVPRDPVVLRTLPGIGPATAAGVAVFAYNDPVPYLETNVRTVFLHEFLADRDRVPDREILPLVEATLDRDRPREWFYALLDYGNGIKRSMPNPSRRSAHHAPQSPFEGSRRQKRAKLLRAVIATPGLSSGDAASELAITSGEAVELLEELAAEGFMRQSEGGWSIRQA